MVHVDSWSSGGNSAAVLNCGAVVFMMECCYGDAGAMKSMVLVVIIGRGAGGVCVVMVVLLVLV